MQLKCIIIDEEPMALEIIKNYLRKIPSLQLLQTFYDVNSTYEFLQNNHIDLLFIDINMPTGIELVRSLKHKLMTIFTSAYKKYAFKGFELEAVDYLLKPIDFERFKKAVNKAIQYQRYKLYSSNTGENSLFVRSGHEMVRIKLNDIEYIEGFVDYMKIHLVNQGPVLTLMTFKAIMEKLPPDEFKRIHRSYIVPVSKVKSVKSKKVLLLSLKELPVSDSYLDFVTEWKRL
jgi:two-component system, LytTR family, response regulator